MQPRAAGLKWLCRWKAGVVTFESGLTSGDKWLTLEGNQMITFTEHPLFTRRITELLTDEEYGCLER